MDKIIKYFKKIFGLNIIDEVLEEIKELVTDEEKKKFKQRKVKDVDWLLHRHL